MLRIFHLLLFVAFVIGGGASSPYTLAYKASLFFPAIEYQNTGVAPLVTFNTTVEKDGVSKEGKLSYHPFQPVYFVTEKDKSIVTPAADIPAIMVAGIIQTKEFEQNFKRVSLSLDAVLTVYAIGNVAKLKYLKDFASAARLTLAGIELSSTALDLLLNYTDLCVDGELCEALREYNFYLQVGLLSGEALSAIYKSQLKALKLKAAEKYAEKRAKLVAKYGENSKEVKALDEHFGIVQGAGNDLASFVNKTPLTQKLDDITTIWNTKYPIPDMLGGRSFFEDIMGHYRYTKSTGWNHTGDISFNVKGIDFYKGTQQGSEIYASTAVSMKTTIKTNVDEWLQYTSVQDNIRFLKEGLTPSGLVDPNNSLKMFMTNAEIHIYMPKANITDALKASWMNKLNTIDSKIKFEIKALEDFIQ